MDRLKEAMENTWFYKFTVVLRLCAVVGILYFFLVALAIMGDAFKAVGGKESGSLFTVINNPITGLMVGVLSTVLVQSSSTTTSVVVSATGSGVLEVQQAVPIIMGANIGTSVTNTIVSLGFANDHQNYERAFAGATVHDMFNFLGVIVWLPLDIIVDALNGGNGGIFASLAAAIVPEDLAASENDDLFIKEAVAKLSKAVISIDKDIIKDYAKGSPDTFCENNPGVIYPMKVKKGCVDSMVSDPSFSSAIPIDDASYLIKDFSGKFKCACENFTLSANGDSSDHGGSGQIYSGYASAKGRCGSALNYDFCVAVTEYPDSNVLQDFGINVSEYIARSTLHAQTIFDNARTVKDGSLFDSGYDDITIGIVALVLSLIMLIVCLIGIVKIMRTIVAGPAEKYIVNALNYNFPGGGYLAILVGAGVTLLVQSSSITTSILTPMVAIGTLTLENMFPFTIGANLGTTGTGLIAGLADGDKDGIQIALCHFFFNLFNAILWYPIPFMREIPLGAARFLGKWATAYRLFPIAYIVVAFVVYPLYFLGVSILLGSGDTGQVAGGTILIIVFLASHISFVYWYRCQGGIQKIRRIVDARSGTQEDAKPKEFPIVKASPQHDLVLA